MGKPKFKIGDVLRYDTGPTALFRVDAVSKNHAGPGKHRYYGTHCGGTPEGVYESDCQPANKADMKKWREYKNWRKSEEKPNGR